MLLRLDVLTELDQLMALRSAWLALEAEAAAELPFQTWEWTVAWWQHLREDSRGVRDYLRVCVVRDATDTILAIAPLILTVRPAVGPLRIRHIQFIGADPNITEIRTLLCRLADKDRCCALLRAHFAEQPEAWDWITWEGSHRAAGASLCGEVKSAFVLELAADWETQKARFGRNLKESLRKCYNSLRRDGLTFRLEIVDQPDRIQAVLPDFFRLHAERADLRGTPEHANVFETRAAQDFLADVCQRLAERGIARVFQLWVDGRVVASRVGFQMGSHVYLYYSGWDSDYGKYSVMTTLLAEIVRYAIGLGLTSVNLSTGNDVSKTRWRPTEVVYTSQVEVSPRRVARARYTGFNVARGIAASKTTRHLLPGFLVRRSEPNGRVGQRVHSLIHAAAALVALDVLESNLVPHLIQSVQ